MKDQLLRRLAELERSRRRVGAPAGRPPEPAVLGWHGRAVFDPGGKRIGHVSLVRLDGTGGAWLEVATDLGVLDWLNGMGAGHTRFTFHSDDMVTRGERELVVRQSILDAGSEAA